jgi:hypothetical protein
MEIRSMLVRRSLFVLALLFGAGCGSSGGVMTKPIDLSTPEATILSLEEAYRARDVNAAVKCKDFRTEAILMLQKVSPELAGDEEIITQTTEVLELGFRTEMKKKGFPDFRGVTSTFKDKKPFRNRSDIVELTETCVDGHGSATTNQLVVAKTEPGWRIVVVAE